MEKLRVGVIGLGAMGKGHLGAYGRIPEAVEVAALCDLREEALAAAGERFPGARTAGDFRELLEPGDLDLVSVITMPQTHCEIAVAALEAGAHVLCEKPLAMSVAEADRMLAAAEGAGRMIQVGTNMRHMLEAGLLRELVASGKLGKPTYIRAWTYYNLHSVVGAALHQGDRRRGSPCLDGDSHNRRGPVGRRKPRPGLRVRLDPPAVPAQAGRDRAGPGGAGQVRRRGHRGGPHPPRYRGHLRPRGHLGPRPARRPLQLRDDLRARHRMLQPPVGADGRGWKDRRPHPHRLCRAGTVPFMGGQREPGRSPGSSPPSARGPSRRRPHARSATCS